MVFPRERVPIKMLASESNPFHPESCSHIQDNKQKKHGGPGGGCFATGLGLDWPTFPVLTVLTPEFEPDPADGAGAGSMGCDGRGSILPPGMRPFG